MKIKTSILQEMVAKAIKGAGMNKMIPITQLLGIEIKNGILTLMTTDHSNYLNITQKLEGDSVDFYTIVNADTFAKLVGKTTKEFMELTNESNFLMVKGNGNYKLEVAVNEDGEIINFPRKNIKTSESQETEKISIEKLKSMLNSGKVCVAKTMEYPCITGYFLSDILLTTDRQMVCNVDEKLVNEPILLSSSTAELLHLLEGTEVELIKDNDELLFNTETMSIYAKQLEGKAQYPVEVIKKLVATQYNSNIKINKQDLLNVLDRMALFVSDYDKGGIYLIVSNDGLEIKSQQSNAAELLEVKLDNQDIPVTEFECLVDIEMFKSQVQSIVGDIVELYYGNKSSLKIKEGNTTMILSLVQKSE